MRRAPAALRRAAPSARCSAFRSEFKWLPVAGSTVTGLPPSSSKLPEVVSTQPAVPALIALFVFVRALTRLDDLQARIQLLAFGSSLGATALLTFGYGFFEGVGMPHLPPVLVLPLMAILWGLATTFFTWRYKWRYRR